MNERTRYAKVVEWSEQDQCYVGSWYVFSVVQAAASGWRGRLVQRERLRNR